MRTALKFKENLKEFNPAKGNVKTAIIDGMVQCIDGNIWKVILKKEWVKDLISNK